MIGSELILLTDTASSAYRRLGGSKAADRSAF